MKLGIALGFLLVDALDATEKLVKISTLGNRIKVSTDVDLLDRTGAGQAIDKLVEVANKAIDGMAMPMIVIKGARDNKVDD